MMRCRILFTSAAFIALISLHTEAYGARETIAVGARGAVQESISLDALVVTQGDASDTPDEINFDDDGDPRENTLRDSNESVKLTFSSNIAAGRLITYTDNSSAAAKPRFCGNPAEGNDGAGLVGKIDCRQHLPLVWVVYDDNEDHEFAMPLGDNEIFITDRAHVATSTSIFKKPDNRNRMDSLALQRCFDGVPVPNPAADELFPQFFGRPGFSLDLCNEQGQEERFAQELSKNIAVIAFYVRGTKALVPVVSTPCDFEREPLDPNCSDTFEAESPIYLPIAAEFSGRPAQEYTTNTLTFEFVQQ